MMKLGDRMKAYEYVSRDYFTRRTPVIVRVDGRAFHTFTKNFHRPFDHEFENAMANSARNLFGEMQGCKMAYIQSDEASFVITDYDNLDTQGWFNYNKSKIVSISASSMTAAFNYAMVGQGRPSRAQFDARAFNIPPDEVANYFLWRAQDWHRNSVSMYAQANFSHGDLHRKSIPEMHEMLHNIGKNWTTDISQRERNGLFLYHNCDGDIQAVTETPPKHADISILWEEACSEIDSC
jgi:tRNA(His) 5'-end guanylyltransferase